MCATCQRPSSAASAASPTIATAIRSTPRWPPFTAPFKLYKLDADKLEWKFLYQDETVLDTSNIETKMVYVTSRDGAKVPMFVSTKRTSNSTAATRPSSTAMAASTSASRSAILARLPPW